MRKPELRIVAFCGCAALLAASLLPAPARAQSVWDKIKQKAKQAEQQAGGQQGQTQGQQQGQQGQPANGASSASQPAAAGQPPSGAQPASAGSGGTAAPWSPGGDTTSSTATAGSASTFASNAPPDFSKLPDISGQLRIGMLPDDVQPAELKMHPGAKVVPMPDALATFRPYSSTGKPPYVGMRAMFGVPDGKHDDTSEFFYTMPPVKQQVFEMHREYSYPDTGIDRLKLIAALRQKYGPETKAIYATRPPTDQYISTMYWVYDEQGNLHAPDKGTPGNAPFGCGVGADSNTWGNMVTGLTSNSLPPANFCDTIVEMIVQLNGPPDNNSNLNGINWQLVSKTITTIMDVPLLRRDAMAAADARKAAAQQQQQQQLDQSKKAVPTL